MKLNLKHTCNIKLTTWTLGFGLVFERFWKFIIYNYKISYHCWRVCHWCLACVILFWNQINSQATNSQANLLATVLYLELAISWILKLILYTQLRHWCLARETLEKLKNDTSRVQDVYLLFRSLINSGTL